MSIDTFDLTRAFESIIKQALPRAGESSVHLRIKDEVMATINRAKAMVAFDDAETRIALLMGSDRGLAKTSSFVTATRAAAEVTWPYIHEGVSGDTYRKKYGHLPDFIFDIGVFDGKKLIGGIEIFCAHTVGRRKVANVARAGLWMVEIPINLIRDRSFDPTTGRVVYSAMKVYLP